MPRALDQRGGTDKLPGLSTPPHPPNVKYILRLVSEFSDAIHIIPNVYAFLSYDISDSFVRLQSLFNSFCDQYELIKL